MVRVTEKEDVKPFNIQSDVPLQTSRAPQRGRMTELNRRILKSTAILKVGQSYLIPEEGSRKNLQKARTNIMAFITRMKKKGALEGKYVARIREKDLHKESGVRVWRKA